MPRDLRKPRWGGITARRLSDSHLYECCDAEFIHRCLVIVETIFAAVVGTMFGFIRDAPVLDRWDVRAAFDAVRRAKSGKQHGED